MQRFLCIVWMFCGFCLSPLASGAEWRVERGDTIWKILAEACQVTPSMEKVGMFARAAGIQTPDHVVIGDRIDVTRGCTALSDSHASLDRVIAMSAGQGEALRVIQARTVAIDGEVAKLRVKLELPNWNGAVNQVALRLSDEQYPSDVNTRIAQGLSSNMEALARQSTGTKGYYALANPAIFSNGWLWTVAAILIFTWFSFIRKRGVSEVWASDASNRNDGVPPSRIPLDFVLSGTGNTAPVDSGLRFLGTSGGGFITLSVPFTWEMYLKFYQRVREDMNFVSFWCALPVFVSGRGYGTFECDAEGNCVYAEKIDAFKASVEGSVKLFIDGESDIALTRRIIAAVKDGLLRPSE